MASTAQSINQRDAGKTSIPTEPCRILVVDDHEVIRRGVRNLLETEWQVCGEASTGREALAEVKRLRPNVVILDITLPELNGLTVLPQILEAVPGTEVLVLTAHESEQMAEAALAAGARGYVLKSDCGGGLMDAVRAVSRHKRHVTPQLARRLDGYSKNAAMEPPVLSPSSLTAREQEICQMFAEGKSTKEVALALQIAVKTAATHRMNIMRKLNLHSLSELVRYAIRNDIVQA